MASGQWAAETLSRRELFWKERAKKMTEFFCIFYSTARTTTTSMAEGGISWSKMATKKIRKGIFYFVPKAETIPPLILFVSREGEIETKGKNDENKPMPKQQHPKNIYSIKCEGKNLLAFAKIYLLAQREKGMQAKKLFYWVNSSIIWPWSLSKFIGLWWEKILSGTFFSKTFFTWMYQENFC